MAEKTVNENVKAIAAGSMKIGLNCIADVFKASDISITPEEAIDLELELFTNLRSNLDKFYPPEVSANLNEKNGKYSAGLIIALSEISGLHAAVAFLSKKIAP